MNHHKPLMTDHRLLSTAYWPLCLFLALITGCASPNVNPPRARAKTGYVDLYADSSGELSWQVARFDPRTQGFKSVFSEFEPPPGRAVRLAVPPGHYRLRVAFINCAVREPGLVEVEVKDGLITPVHVALIPDGTTQVETKETRVGGTFKGRYGRGTKFSSDASSMNRVSLEPKPAVLYQVKEQMPYAH